jgi:shikimate dehydrogenase
VDGVAGVGRAVALQGVDGAAADAVAVINATSLGLNGGPGPVVPWRRLAPGAVAMDMVYKPLRTVFLEEAAAHGLRTVDGLEM